MRNFFSIPTPKHALKLFLGVCLFGSLGYSHSVSSCTDLAGFWSGTYQDQGDLFPHQAFPLSLYLKVSTQDKINYFYGYTLESADESADNNSDRLGPRWGADAPMWIFGRCQVQADHLILEKLYLINPAHPCGDPIARQSVLEGSSLNLKLPYENAMTQTVFLAKLESINQMKKIKKVDVVNLQVLADVEQASKLSIASCH